LEETSTYWPAILQYNLFLYLYRVHSKHCHRVITQLQSINIITRERVTRFESFTTKIRAVVPRFERHRRRTQNVSQNGCNRVWHSVMSLFTVPLEDVLFAA